ncbi:MAG TPA: hypothetical protein VGO53_09215, partial [Steroidobacteraceae bacterium]|nr:hypothetical protein [Steroidobacteraceae bacterium]
MHNILTRVFLSFWGAIVLIAAGAVGVAALDFASDAGEPDTVTRQAGDVLKRDGLEGLRVWLAERNRSHRQQRTLIIDASGRDILGQKLPNFRGPPPLGRPPGGGEARFMPPPSG